MGSVTKKVEWCDVCGEIVTVYQFEYGNLNFDSMLAGELASEECPNRGKAELCKVCIIKFMEHIGSRMNFRKAPKDGMAQIEATLDDDWGRLDSQ